MNVYLLVAIATVVAALVIVAFRRSPKLAAVFFVGVLCFVPYWVGFAAINVWFAPTTLAAALVLVGLFRFARPRLSVIDFVIALLVAIYLGALALRIANIDNATVLLTQWIPAYIVGRVIGRRFALSWVYSLVAIAMSIAALLALLEFATGFNPFTLIHVSNYQYSTWATVISRGGLPRAEGAFGHPISLGASLAMAIPLALESRPKLPIRIGMAVLMLGASVVTFSRIGMISALIGLALTVVVVRGQLTGRARVAVTATALATILILLPFVFTILSDAGDEASGSAAYRGNLTSLVPFMRLIGLSHSYYLLPTGEVRYGDFGSIDSALILLGLTHGLLSLVIVLTLLGAAVVIVLIRRGTPPLVSVVAQIPALATVALITQYTMFFWFIVGLAVTAQLVQSEKRSNPSPFHFRSRTPRHKPYNEEPNPFSSLAPSPALLTSEPVELRDERAALPTGGTPQ